MTDRLLKIKSNNEVLDYTIYDLNGRLIRNEKLKKNQQEINVSTLSKGVYLITLSTNKGFKTQKFIKK